MNYKHEHKWVLRQEGPSTLHLQKAYQLLWKLVQKNEPTRQENSDDNSSICPRLNETTRAGSNYPRQLAQLTSYAQKNGYQIPAELQFIDEAVSGNTLRREGLDRLRNAVSSGQINVLLCLSPDRLARNLGVQQLLLSELSHFGVEVIS